MRFRLFITCVKWQVVGAAVVAGLAPAGASAQPAFETLHQFAEGQGAPFGRLLEASDGRLYGVNSRGGAFSGGTIFAIDRGLGGTHAVTTFHDFRRSEGWHPYSGLIEGSDGSLYGTTADGGALGGGTVFRINRFGQLVVIHVLNPATDGRSPMGALVQAADGRFYGTTVSGGPGGEGTVFSVAQTGGFTVLHAFSGPDGAAPVGALIQGHDGQFYGTTRNGGDSGVGTVFRISSGGSFVSLTSFARSGTNTPLAGLAEVSPGLFCGTNAAGFGLNLPGGAQFVVSGGLFCINGAGASQSNVWFISGEVPVSPLLVASDGFAYFAADQGATAVFRYSPSGGPELLARVEARSPFGGLTETSDGRLYGVAFSGAIFMMDSPDSARVVHTFTSDGFNPTGRLLRSVDGDFYGTTSSGGTPLEWWMRPAGTGFRFSLAGGHQTIASLSTISGARAVGDLTEAPDGRLFGTTEAEVFVLSKAGDINPELPCTTHVFSSPLTLGLDGRLYGVHWDTPSGHGSVSRTTTEGCPSDRPHVFTGADGSVPFGGVLQASDGDFYGTTSAGGAFGVGTIYKMTADGVLTTLHHFAETDGASPAGPLIEGLDGVLYGTTVLGGDQGVGTVFRISRDGAFETLHDLQLSEGAYVFAGLTQASDGAFYGAAAAGGLGAGTVFRITATGVFSVVHRFGPGEGAYPIAGLTEGTDGHLYGMTPWGGQRNAGTIYRILVGGS